MLLARDFLNVQGGISGSRKLKIQDISDIRFFKNLTQFHCSHNEIASLEPVGSLVSLRRITFCHNRICDISPLVSCQELRDIELRDNPIKSFVPLAGLPHLHTLEISGDQVAQFHGVKSLDRLRYLKISGNFESLALLPELPSLQILKIQCCYATDMAGIERFQNLRNLWAVGNKFRSITPLAACTKLTHVVLSGSPFRDLTPLATLIELRSLHMKECDIVDVKPLYALPALHEVWLEKNPVSEDEASKLKGDLSSWDIEFASDHANDAAGMDLRTVTQEEFDFHDKNRSNVEDFDGDNGLFQSEQSWLIFQITDALGIDLGKDDFYIPDSGVVRRSHTVVLLTDGAVRRLPLVVGHIQRVLRRARKTWIIYLEADSTEIDDDFVLWVYPDHIDAKSKDRLAVEALLSL